MDESKMSDEELMVLYQSGEMKAFEMLYARHSGRVLQYLKAKTSAESAHELLQEIFAKVHRSRSQYSSQYPFLPWLFAMTRNVIIDYFRLNESKVARESLHDVSAIEEAADHREEIPLDLSQVLQTLPASQRRAIELRYLSDWTFEQIASDLKTTPENVRQVISRGIKKLRSSLGGGS